MNRYIDVEAFFKAMNETLCNDAGDHDAEVINHTIGEVCNLLLRFPTADVAEVKHGHWKHLALEPYDITGHTYGDCSICGKRRIVDNYCPNCGAKMENEDE